MVASVAEEAAATAGWMTKRTGIRAGWALDQDRLAECVRGRCHLCAFSRMLGGTHEVTDKRWSTLWHAERGGLV